MAATHPHRDMTPGTVRLLAASDDWVAGGRRLTRRLLTPLACLLLQGGTPISSRSCGMARRAQAVAC
jgi:hypothetical protein